MNNEINVKLILANNIKKIMKEKQVTRQQLATDLDVKYSTLCEWLKGTKLPRSEKLDALSEYFDITIAELMAPDRLESMLKAPIIVELKPDISINDALKHNYGYRLTTDENCFTFKLFDEVGEKFSLARPGDTMLFQIRDFSNIDLLEDGKSYFIRRKGKYGEIARLVKTNNLILLVPYFNKEHDYEPIVYTEDCDIEIIAVALELITPV